MTPGEVQGEMKRHVRPLSLDTIGTSVGVALGNVIRSGSENVVTGVFVSIVWAVTSTGMPPAHQVIPTRGAIGPPSCGAPSTVSPPTRRRGALRRRLDDRRVARGRGSVGRGPRARRLVVGRPQRAARSGRRRLGGR